MACVHSDNFASPELVTVLLDFITKADDAIRICRPCEEEPQHAFDCVWLLFTCLTGLHESVSSQPAIKSSVCSLQLTFSGRGSHKLHA